MAGAAALPGQEIVPDVGRDQPAGEIPPQPPEVPSVRDEIVGPSTIPSATPELPTEVAEFDFDEGQLPPSEFSLLINRRIRRLGPVIEEQTGGTFDPNSTETSDLLKGKGIAAFGFAESYDEVMNLYEGIHGEGKVRVFQDPDARIYEPEFYVSLEKEDGTYTPFSSPIQSAYDVAKIIGGQAAYELPVGSASVASAWAVAGTTAAILGATTATALLAPVVAGGLALYTLYAMGGSGEKFKQEVLKDQLGLTEKEADETGTFFEEAFRVYNEGVTPTGLGGEEFTQQEKFAGYVELGMGALGMVFDKMRMATGRLRRKYIKAQQEGMSLEGTFDSAVAAQSFAREQGLVGLTLGEVKDNRIIDRLESLASQTSIIIPTKIRKQMDSAVKYLRDYSDDLGEGNFAQFQNQLDDLQNFWSANRDRTPDYEAIGTTMTEIDSMFRNLRYIEAQGMYSNVFDAIGSRSYDLSTIDEVIRSRTRAVIPEKVEGETISGVQMPFQRGEMQIYDTIDVLKTIGTNKDGTLTSGRGLQQAVSEFNKANPGYEISLKDGDQVIDTPAKMLQMFATRFGEMARDLKNMPVDQQTAASRRARSTAMETRNALLELIGNPNGADDALKSQIRSDLADANAFYKETYDIVEQAGIQRKLSDPGFVEPSMFSKEILQKSKAGSVEGLLEAVNKQAEYIKSRIPTADPSELKQLQSAFKQLVDIETARTFPGEAGEPTNASAVRDFFDRFSDQERERLGFTQDMVDERLAEADFLAEMATGDAAKVTGKYSPASTRLLKVFGDAFDSSDPNAAIFRMVQVAKRDAADTDEGILNLRKGLFDYLVSTQSGVLKEITKNTATRRAGTPGSPNFEIDADRLAKVLTDIDEVMPELRNILTDDDITMLQGLSNYVNTINRAGADAGSALSGAQIIGELFTIDPEKMLQGLARLGAQKRMSQLLTSDKLVDAAAGTVKAGKDIRDGNFTDTVLTYFTGKGAMGAIIADIAFNPKSEDEQMREMFANQPLTAPMPMYDLEQTN